MRTPGLGSVGLIGSAGKWSRFRRTLLGDGHEPDVVDGIRTPIGLPELVGKDPAVIAVSVAASSSRVASVLTCWRSQFSENFMVSSWWARRMRLGLRIWEQPSMARPYTVAAYANCFRNRTSFSKNARRSLTP